MPNTQWEYCPPFEGYPATYKHLVQNMLVVQGGPRSWSSYHLAYGSVVEGVFTTEREALEWCNARVM